MCAWIDIDMATRREWQRGEPRIAATPMRTYTVVIERDSETGLLVGYVPGFAGAHSQAETLDELQANLREVIEMLLEDGYGPGRR